MLGNTPFCELAALSNFSFLEGASHPEEIIARAAKLQLGAVAIADRHTMAGVVRAHVAAQQHDMQLVVGTRCSFLLGADEEPTHLELVLLAESVDGYARMCRLLTLGKRRAGWTLDMDANVAAVAAGIESRAAARNSSACHLWLHDLVDASVQSLGSGEPGDRSGHGSGRAPGTDRPLAPFAIPGVHAIVIPPDEYGAMQPCFLESLRWLRTVFDDDRLSLGFVRHSGPDDALRLLQLEWISSEVCVPLLASNNPYCHVRNRQELQDILTAIRAGHTVQELRSFERTRAVDRAHGCAYRGARLLPDDARHLVDGKGMHDVLCDVPRDICEASIARSVQIAERCAGFSMSTLRYRYPREVAPPGVDPMAHLRILVEDGAAQRWPAISPCRESIPTKVRAQLEHEFSIIAELGYACYFLTVHAIVSFARANNILCQGRGAAANSAVCFCLGITAVDPTRSDMLFERFISRERDEPPDIDVDFEHERREEVIQFIYRTWGRSRAALCAEVICFRDRSSLREAAKALGVPPESPDALRIAAALEGFPRHLSQHVGGFIITDGPLCELVPVRNARMDARTIVEWDKDDIDAMGMLKMDVLALGMLTAIRKAIDLGNAHPVPSWPLDSSGAGALMYRTVPAEDAATYEMACRADTVGVFQIESRAQMSMLPRLKPRCFYDLVIEVAIVRPGPIQGDMVHPYLRRRDGIDPTHYPNEAIRAVLGKTLGVPLFQEQAMLLAVVAAGFTPGEADRLRRAIASWKRSGNQIAAFKDQLESGMRARGYPEHFAAQVFGQIQGFSGYGFPESHAASFALLIYVSAWLKCHHPAAFTAALLNSQPMGFYAPAQLVRDAREHGVDVRAIDVSESEWDCTLEGEFSHPALRLGLRMVTGLRAEDGCAVAAAARSLRMGGSLQHAGSAVHTDSTLTGTCCERSRPLFPCVESLWRASGCSLHALRRLAAADAFAGIGIPRQQALWQVRALRDGDTPVLDDAAARGATLFDMQTQPLPPVSALRSVAADYSSTGLSLHDHPIRFLRESIARRGGSECIHLRSIGEATEHPTAAVAGLVLCRQRPSTASGTMFMTIEDETGIANLIFRPRVCERYRTIARHASALLAEGTVEHRSGVTHLLVRRVTDLTDELSHMARGDHIAQRSRDFR
ncbi:MAG: PHP domain-containing protein [Planctomycetota bacterium]|nr:MAG: PHP domain-containing protein [Planctomycetota bacterium]